MQNNDLRKVWKRKTLNIISNINQSKMQKARGNENALDVPPYFFNFKKFNLLGNEYV